MSEVETFVKIEGFEKYEVSNLGKVRNIKSGRVLKPYLHKESGYLRLFLCENNKKKNLLLHRIIATAFIDNPEEKPRVNHIDKNKLNNDLSNLKWCALREKVIQLDLNDNVLNAFESMKQAERETGTPTGNISKCCNGRAKSAGGYKWIKKEKEEKMETINIKFDEEQLEDIVKKVTEKLKEEKTNFYELSDTGREEKKEKRIVMYLEARVSSYSSEDKKLYFGDFFNTLSKECATDFDLSFTFDRKKVEELKSQGWKEEVIYK
ncbi:putative HNH endonuclease [Lactococcus phage phi7]|uniref:Putative HNH endonuclease n=1 Tax=Lactococcus phage phi7 TaxID=1262538 RepID=R9R2G2_9CAUD|nr:putative HNH endonuclease [Lactococcus phage phi7]AGI11221.1 putative HNH endonuclease [Lactococcus phage phi7]